MLYRSRLPVILLLSAVAALAQWRRQDPINAAIQDYYRLRDEGHLDGSIARREDVRTMVGQTPVVAPQFMNWVQRTPHLYDQSGKTVDARSVLELALARANRLGAHPTWILPLNLLADSWQSDGSLVKAATYLEEAAGELDATPGATREVAPGFDPTYIYQHLAEIYRQLGRPMAASAVVGKIASRLRSDRYTLAALGHARPCPGPQENLRRADVAQSA